MEGGRNYARLEKFAEQFETRHDADKMAQNMEEKLISPELKLTGGYSRSSLQGGGINRKTESIENGTKQTVKEFRWSISREQ